MIDESRATRWQRYAPDVAVGTALVVVALLVRWPGLPTNGLWLDDAVTADGVKASVSQLLSVGFDHPGFTAWLMGWSRLTGGSDASLAYPALIAGALGAGLLYAALRWCGYARSVSALLGAALVASQTDIIYSARVKTYTIDAVIVLALALVVPRLARRRWSWATGVLWLVAGIVIASFSGFALIASAAAGAIFVLHPRSDLRVRIVAVGLQETTHVAFLLAGFGGQYSYAAGSLDVAWRHTWNAFVDLSLDPVRFATNAIEHLVRVAEVFPGGPVWFATVCSITALVGLVLSSSRGPQVLRARYLLLVLLAAFVGSVLGKFPFGPEQVNLIAPGGRVSIWLAPVVAFGLAIVLERVRGAGTAGSRRCVGFDIVASIGAVAVLGVAIGGARYQYPFPGAHSSAAFIQSGLRSNEPVLMVFHADYILAAESSIPVKLEPQPVFSDARVHLVGLRVSPGQVADDVGTADRVLVYAPEPPFNNAEAGAREDLDSTLLGLGFEQQRNVGFDRARVEVWHRRQATAADIANLRLSDLPAGWQRTPASPNSQSSALLDCLRTPNGTTAESTVAVNGRRAGTQLSVTSEVSSWSSPTALQSAYAAMSGPQSAQCVASILQTALMKAGLPTTVTAARVLPPPAASGAAVAYDETVQTAIGARTVAHGTLVFFSHGETAVLISGLGTDQQTFPTDLLSNVVAAVSGRVTTSPAGA